MEAAETINVSIVKIAPAEGQLVIELAYAKEEDGKVHDRVGQVQPWSLRITKTTSWARNKRMGSNLSGAKVRLLYRPIFLVLSIPVQATNLDLSSANEYCVDAQLQMIVYLTSLVGQKDRLTVALVLVF